MALTAEAAGFADGMTISQLNDELDRVFNSKEFAEGSVMDLQVMVEMQTVGGEAAGRDPVLVSVRSVRWDYVQGRVVFETA